MIIQEVPKSASPRDVLRALQQNGAVDQDFPISASMSSEIGLS
jgi:hypothetical protein